MLALHVESSFSQNIVRVAASNILCVLARCDIRGTGGNGFGWSNGGQDECRLHAASLICVMVFLLIFICATTRLCTPPGEDYGKQMQDDLLAAVKEVNDGYITGV